MHAIKSTPFPTTYAHVFARHRRRAHGDGAVGLAAPILDARERSGALHKVPGVALGIHDRASTKFVVRFDLRGFILKV
jgi:hypothetical protein